MTTFDQSYWYHDTDEVSQALVASPSTIPDIPGRSLALRLHYPQLGFRLSPGLQNPYLGSSATIGVSSSKNQNSARVDALCITQ